MLGMKLARILYWKRSNQSTNTEGDLEKIEERNSSKMGEKEQRQTRKSEH